MTGVYAYYFFALVHCSFDRKAQSDRAVCLRIPLTWYIVHLIREINSPQRWNECRARVSQFQMHCSHCFFGSSFVQKI